MLGAAGYLVGAVALGAVLAVVGCGSWRVREALLPGWQGAIARLAELVIGLFVVLTTAQVLGAIGAFDRVPVLAAELAVGAALYAGAGRPRPRQSAVVSPAAPVLGRVELAGAAVGVGLVVVQWATHVAYALSKGMTYSDTMWYHQPFAARFVQHHSFSALDGVGLEAARRYPLSSPLLHALGMLAFNRDIVSPFINLGWLLLALLAAWCIGRRSGLGHVCTLGAAVAVGLPILTATQPGQASSDVAAVALFLAAVALLLESDLQPAPTAIGGLALGMALSMKITVAAPAAVLALGVVALAWRARRLSAVLWVCALGASGSFWFLRNWWLVGSPVPWFDVRLGPLHLRVHEAASAVASGQPSLAHGIANTDVWPDFYLDALWQGFGRIWPVLFLLLVLAIGLLIVRGRTPLHRLLGVALGVGCVGYVFTPYTGGLNFGSGLRFLSPLLLAAFVLLPTHLPNDARWRRGELVALLVLAVVSATMPTDARVPSWPSRWVLPTLAVLGSIGAAGIGVARLRHRDSHRGTMVSTGAALGMLLLLGGWFMQREYLEHRYVNVGLPNDPLDEYFRDVRDARVAVLGTDDTFPMFGLDLSNDVRRGDDPSFDLGADPCVTWRRHLAGYDYVAITRGPVAFGGYPTPDDDVFADPAATEVMRVGANVVYRLRGRLDPATCPAV